MACRAPNPRLADPTQPATHALEPRLGQAYLAAFAAVAQFSSSPFLPVRLGRLECDFVPGETLLVRWNTSIAARDAFSEQEGAPTRLTGESVYEIDQTGQLCSHTLQDLRFGGRRLLYPKPNPSPTAHPNLTPALTLGLTRARTRTLTLRPTPTLPPSPPP